MKSACFRVLISASAIAGLPALDLPGVPGPQPVGPERVRVDWGNDAFGPGGGGQSDDFRTNEVSAYVTWSSWFVGLDHSMLTLGNPSGAPVYWGYSDPLQYYSAGARRIDEMTLSAGWRGERSAGPARGWIQAGPGVLISGDLGGKDLQNGTHGMIGNGGKEMPYERDELHADGFAHAGLGGRLGLGGPLVLVADALGQVTPSGWARGRADLLLTVAAPGGGTWAGIQVDGSTGTATSTTAAAVADHEAGLSLTLGWDIRIDQVGLAFATARNLHNDGQEGHLSLTWQPEPGPLRAGTSERPWISRIGLFTGDSAVAGRGIDTALGIPLGSGGWFAMLGMRDQAVSVPFTYDITSRRRLLWAGLGLQPRLAQWGWLRVTAPLEAGLGWSHARVASRGFVTVDGGNEVESDALVGRVAAGLGGDAVIGQGLSAGLAALLEGTVSSSSRSVELTTLDPDSGIARRSESLQLQGSAVGAVIALTAAWRW